MSHRVLVVDDDDDVRELTQLALEKRGFEVIPLSSGSEALGYLARDTPGLILLDLEMDDVSGWAVLSALPRHPKFKAMRVIVVSGSRATVPSWAGYIAKPFRIEALLALIGEPS